MKINIKMFARINDAGIKVGVLYFRTLFGHENFGIDTEISYSKTALLYNLEFASYFTSNIFPIHLNNQHCKVRSKSHVLIFFCVLRILPKFCFVKILLEQKLYICSDNPSNNII